MVDIKLNIKAHEDIAVACLSVETAQEVRVSKVTKNILSVKINTIAHQKVTGIKRMPFVEN
jgi:hypothetical protein